MRSNPYAVSYIMNTTTEDDYADLMDSVLKGHKITTPSATELKWYRKKLEQRRDLLRKSIVKSTAEILQAGVEYLDYNLTMFEIAKYTKNLAQVEDRIKQLRKARKKARI